MFEDAIRSRHSKDLIVFECKDGPTWGGSHLRLDAWVLRRSWTNPAMIGYELKSSRADFLADKKWPQYLPLCNELWFVADPKHIQPGELPEGVGHLRLAGSRLVTVKRAAWRDIEPPVGLLTYVLMCRSKIEREHHTASDQSDYWRQWLAKREYDRTLGYSVSKALREMYQRDVLDARERAERAEKRTAAAERLSAALAAKGIKFESWTTVDDVERGLRVPHWEVAKIESARDALNKLLANGGGE